MGDLDSRKRQQDDSPAPLGKRTRGQDPETSKHSGVVLRVPEMECEAKQTREAEVERGINKKRPVSTRNGSCTPPVVVEEEDESPLLKKKVCGHYIGLCSSFMKDVRCG